MPTVGLKVGFVNSSSYTRDDSESNNEIKLINNPGAEITSPPKTIQGLFLLHVGMDCRIENIRIQLEGHAISRSEGKNESRRVNDSKDEIFTPEDLCAVPLDYKIQKYAVGTYTFPFEIELCGQEFPATFKSPFGEIYYKLVAYVNQVNPRGFLINSITLTSKGHLNLHFHPKLRDPQLVTKQRERPWFSSRPTFKIQFRVNKKGFLPQENLNFAVIVENPTCDRVVKIQMVFVQKITYFARIVTKTVRNVLLEKTNQVDSCDADIHWEAGFEIPANLMPSFKKGRKYLEINYTIEFTVWMADAPPFKSEIGIVIGTVTLAQSASASALTSNLNLNLAAGGSKHQNIPNRSQSFSDLNWDALSPQSCSTLPPSYSNLSSRRPSLSSIETLPPNYASVMRVMYEKDEGNEEWEDLNDFRPCCSTTTNAK